MSLPQLPKLEDIGLTPEAIRSDSIPNRASDGKKKVRYRATRPRNVRVTPSFSSSKEKGYKRREQQRGYKPFPNFQITPHGETIVQFIQQVPILAVDSPTGTGKTLYIPYLLATKGFRVRVAIPSTVAVRNAYRFIKKYSSLQVGFAAAREIHYSDSDALVYATTGHFTRRILKIIKESNRKAAGSLQIQKNIKTALGDVIVIDEVHTATSQITLLIGLLRYIFVVNNQYIGPKIVFSTATFNHGDILVHFPEFPVYKIDIESKPVTDIYLDNVRDPLKDNVESEIERIVQLELDRWHQSAQKYHGIIFRPGVQEVEDTLELLESKFPQIEFYPAYSSLTSNELDDIFKKSDRMKIVVGTNIIESGITIEDVGFIIDDMLEKIAETSSIGGDRLTLSLISRAGSQQRRGRTGRTIEGRNYRLFTIEQFNALPAFRQKEIDRVPIFDIVLQLIDSGLHPRDILQITISRYDQARRLLISFGMIENRGDRYYVTNAGIFVSSLGIGINTAYMVYLGYQHFLEKSLQDSDCSSERILLRTIIAVASMIEAYGPSYFYIPRKERNETYSEYRVRQDAYIEQYHEKFRGPSDIHTFVNIFWTMMTDINIARQYDTSTHRRFPDYIREWSNNNSMNNKKLREFLNVMRDIESTVEAKLRSNHELRNDLPKREPPGSLLRLSKDVPSGGYDLLGNLVSEIFTRAYRQNKFIREVDQSGKISYIQPKTGIVYRISRRSTFTNIILTRSEGPDAIIAAQTIEVIGKNGGKFHLAGIIVPNKFFDEM